MGQAKESLILRNGLTLLDQAQRTLKSIVEGTVWISRPYNYPHPAPTDVPDPAFDRGPLMGVAEALSRSQYPLLAVLAVDMPLIPPALYEELYAHWLSHPLADVVYPEANGISQPLAGLWHRRGLATLRKALQTSPKVQNVLDQLTTQRFPLEQAEWLTNLNHPDEWKHFKENF